MSPKRLCQQKGLTARSKRVVNKQWFLVNLDALGMNQHDLAKYLGVDRSAVSLLLTGKRRIKMREAVAIAELFGVKESEVSYNAGERKTPEAAKDLITANVTDFATGDNNLRIVPAKTDIPIVVPPGISAKACRILQIKNPQGFMHDWKMFYYPSSKVAANVAYRLCVVKKEGEASLYLRQVNPGSGPGRYELINPFRIDQVEADVVLRSAAPIEALRQA